jgi:penicillin-binding protein 2
VKRSLTLQDHRHRARSLRLRVGVAVLVMLAAQAYVLSRLFELQLWKQAHYATLSNENRVRVQPLAPSRGLVYTRDGVLIAENRPSFDLVVVPEQVESYDQLFAQLGEVIALDEELIERFHKLRKRKRRFDDIPLKAGLNPREVARFAVERHRFPAAHIEATPTRFYPEGELYTHVLGYVGRIDEADLAVADPSNYAATTHYGKLGVERTYEEILHGRVGYEQVEVNAQGRSLRVLERTAPAPGKDLYLSIDATLQRAAWDALGEFRGAIVAIEPVTGRVLALVSKPSYDPNLFVNGISLADYAAIKEDPDRPQYNRAIQARYPPGSTVKPMVGLAGLLAGVRTPAEPTFCPGFYRLPGQSHQYRDWKRTGHGTLDLHQAIAQSCDVYFYSLARDLGIDRLHETMSQFGFGQRTGIDLPSENAGLMPSRAWKEGDRQQPWYPGETLIAGIGQGYWLSTPLQLAHAVATLSRRGVRRVPRVVGQIEDPVALNASEVFGEETRVFAEAPPEYWTTVAEAMHAVVQGPTGTARRTGLDAPYAYAGKTGTAQVVGIAQGARYDAAKVAERHKDHGLFVAWAPLEDPVIALAVVVENGGSGSGAAAPVARRLLDVYLGVVDPAAEAAAAAAAVSGDPAAASATATAAGTGSAASVSPPSPANAED